MVLHANLLHLLTNNYSLNSLGPAVEGLCGRQRFVSVYMASALVGSLASYAFNPIPSVGASGEHRNQRKYVLLSLQALHSFVNLWELQVPPEVAVALLETSQLLTKHSSGL